MSLIDEIMEMAREICDDYGYEMPTIELSEAMTRRWGVCYQREKHIKLSAKFCRSNTIDVVYDLLKHEIAHLKHGGHGEDFKNACGEMGISAHTHIDHPDAVTVGKYKYLCIACGHIYSVGRKYNKSHSCGRCSPGKYDERFKLVDVSE